MNASNLLNDVIMCMAPLKWKNGLKSSRQQLRVKFCSLLFQKQASNMLPVKEDKYILDLTWQ